MSKYCVQKQLSGERFLLPPFRVIVHYFRGVEAETWSIWLLHIHSQEQKENESYVSILCNPLSIFTQSRSETKGMVPPTMGGLPTWINIIERISHRLAHRTMWPRLTCVCSLLWWLQVVFKLTMNMKHQQFYGRQNSRHDAFPFEIHFPTSNPCIPLLHTAEQ